MANTVWMEPGTDATQDFSFYSSASGSYSSATDQSYTGGRSLKLSTGNPATIAKSVRNNVLADTGRRISFYFRFSNTPAASGLIAYIADNGELELFGLRLNTSNKLVVAGVASSSALTAGQWYRIALAYTVTSTTEWSAKVYINGVEAISLVNASTLSRTGSSALAFYISSGLGADRDCWYDDIYVDDGTDLGDPGDIRVTAKRPYANGGTNSFDTTTSTSNSAYGTGNSIYVNERPLTANGARRHNGTTAAAENFLLEDPSVGDVNISGKTLVGHLSWVHASGVSTDAIYINGTSVVPTTAISGTAGICYVVADSTNYPASGSAVGLNRVTGSATDAILNECGMLIAYRKAVTPIWMESGTDATQDLSFYSFSSGTVESATDQSHTGGRSLKLSTGSPAAGAAANRDSVLASAGRRISFWLRFSTLPAGNATCAQGYNPSFASTFGVSVTSGGLLRLTAPGTTGINGTTAMAANTWHRVSLAYVISSASSFTFNVYLNGVLQITQTSGTLTNIDASIFELVLSTQFGANASIWFDDVYIDDGTDLGDPGDIRITAKRPYANGTNTFDTTTSTSNSAYGTGASIYVNERPLATTGARRYNANTSISTGNVAFTAAATTTSFTLTIPSTTTTDDILVLAAVNRDATADPTVTDNDTGGNTWAKLASQNAATNGAVSVWWKRATSGSAGKTINASGFTGSSAGGVVWYRGASTDANPFSGTTVIGEANASGNETQAEITVGATDTEVILVVGCTSNDTLDVTSQAATDPSSLTERFEATSTGGSDCSISLASAPKASSGATGDFTWAQTNGTGASLAFALRPKDILETFTLEDASTGDTNVTRKIFVGYLSWAHASGVSTDYIYANGTAFTPATMFTSTAAVRYVTGNSSSYPSSASAVGMGRPLHNTTDAILNECGMLIAYYPSGRMPLVVIRPQFYSRMRR